MSLPLTHSRPGFLLLFCLLIPAGAAAQQLIATPDAMTTLREKWNWATELAAQENVANTSVAYQFSVQLDEKLGVAISSLGNDYYQWNNRRGNWYYGDSSRWNNGLSMQSLLAGNVNSQQDFPVSKNMLLLANYRHGELRELKVVEADSVIDWRQSPIYWLGRVSEEESFRFLVGLFATLDATDKRSALVRAIGLHRGDDRDSFLIRALGQAEYSALRPAVLESIALQESLAAQSLLMDVAQDDNDTVTARRIAISALSRYESAQVEAALVELAGNLNPQAIRREALESLGSFSSPQASQTLQSIMQNDTNIAVVEEAMRSLSLRPEAFDAISAVARNHSNSELREEAVSILGAMDIYLAFDVLSEIAEDDASYDVREEAISEIESAPPALAVPYLVAFAGAESRHPLDVRKEAVESLASFNAELVLMPLNQLAWSDSNEDIREEAIESLADLEDPQADQLLLEIAKQHPSNHTRHEALAKLQENLL
ncbi:MAG: hypothetical protein DHS20C12_28080 [Pseudohongiella sp.]|nr:MAG: hypothetical protein DHS20C12_28080 [Pseudohongiella sp.]